MLPPGNFEVLEAKDGEEGLKLIRQARPNLIMLDFLLPKVSGWEVFQQIQSNAELRSIPLVLMSGRKEEVTEKIQEPFKHFAFIEKPFEKKTLIEAIKLAMKIAPKAPAPAAAAAPTAAAGDAASGDSSADVQALKQQMVKMQAEIDGLKKQITQIMTFIKQKMK
jgi:CheY-like chemotaxis protein